MLANLDKYYLGAKDSEFAGFFWWQGDKDMRNPAHFERYEINLINLIKALRKDFDAPDAKFVAASLGQTREGSTGGDGVILNAIKAVEDMGFDSLLTSDKLDAKLAEFVILSKATPRGLAEFAARGEKQEKLIAQLLTDGDLMSWMSRAPSSSLMEGDEKDIARGGDLEQGGRPVRALRRRG